MITISSDEVDTLKNSDAFDAEWYLKTYKDVAALGMDPAEHFLKYGSRMGRKPNGLVRQLRRIVLIVTDVTTIGGISSRTKRVLAGRESRDIEYIAMTLKNEFKYDVDGALCLAADPKKLRAELAKWTAEDTVFIVSNNTLKPFPKDIKEKVNKCPIIYLAAGQMAFIVQDSTVLLDKDYVENHKATKIISFSDADINFQRQLGIHGQVKGFAPINVRDKNNFDKKQNKSLGYVGRIDFHTKDCMKLIDAALELRALGMPPLKVFTTDGRNSPDLAPFMERIERENLADQFEFTLNCTDKEVIYRNLAMLLLPSRKESFGNVVLEAFSFGVPVMAASYAPGPAELIANNKTGYLLDQMTGRNIADKFSGLDEKTLAEMSDAAFERHKHYSLESHYDMLEKTAAEAIAEFDGVNRMPILPKLKILEKLGAKK